MDEDESELAPAPDPLLDEVETKVFYAGGDDPRNMWVRLIHRETGIEVESTTEGSQLRIANEPCGSSANA